MNYANYVMYGTHYNLYYTNSRIPHGHALLKAQPQLPHALRHSPLQQLAYGARVRHAIQHPRRSRGAARQIMLNQGSTLWERCPETRYPLSRSSPPPIVAPTSRLLIVFQFASRSLLRPCACLCLYYASNPQSRPRYRRCVRSRPRALCL